uniref:Uncharacterized protein n=1 Tax=Physcomitrium patens TaxID=3218 RepID=A0A2K1K2Q6_PHYPA|nr:hypothetical protein PHYPA_012527 [Physcomitrium patens]
MQSQGKRSLLQALKRAELFTSSDPAGIFKPKRIWPRPHIFDLQALSSAMRSSASSGQVAVTRRTRCSETFQDHSCKVAVQGLVES